MPPTLLELTDVWIECVPGSVFTTDYNASHAFAGYCEAE